MFPPEIYSLTRLRRLWINDCLDPHAALSFAPAITNLSALQTLLAEGNRMKSLPESFGELTRLEDLSLRGNQLKAEWDGLRGEAGLMARSGMS